MRGLQIIEIKINKIYAHPKSKRNQKKCIKH